MADMEMAMNGNDVLQGGRALAQIESDLLTAEAAFADADTRLKEAERDRRAAVDTINRHQMEFDKAVAELRRRSTAGSKWRLEMEKPEDALILQTEDMAEDQNVSNRPKPKSVLEEFDRLKTLVQSVGNDPGEKSFKKGPMF